jgi:hypothetical protein
VSPTSNSILSHSHRSDSFHASEADSRPPPIKPLPLDDGEHPVQTSHGQSVSAAERLLRPQAVVRRPTKRPAALVRNLPSVGDRSREASQPDVDDRQWQLPLAANGESRPFGDIRFAGTIAAKKSLARAAGEQPWGKLARRAAPQQLEATGLTGSF